MYLSQMISNITTSITDEEITNYLQTFASYKALDSLFNSDKLGSTNLKTSFKLELFYAMNEDIPLDSIGTTSDKLSTLFDTSFQLYEKKGSEFIPIQYDANKLNSSYILYNGEYLPPVMLFGIDYFTGKLPPKTKKLTQLYNIQTAIALDDRFSYRDDNNLNSEIKKILKIVDSDENSTFVKFINDVGTTKFIRTIIDNYSIIFTNRNGTLPEMFTTDKIALFSALLNFSKNQLDNTEVYLKYLKSIYNNNEIDIYSEWDSIRVLFEKFLIELSRRTIHY